MKKKVTERAPAGPVFREIPLNEIEPNPLNPRKRGFDGQAFDELVASIRQVGILEPVLVRAKGKGFELIAGERRYRACCAIAETNGGLKSNSIPAIVRDLDDDQAFDAMMIENLQREDLSELEGAESFKAWVDKRGPESIDDLAQRTGIGTGYIRRRIAVLELPEKALKAWDKGKIRYAHLELLIRIKDKKLLSEAMDMAINNGWAVKDLRRRFQENSPKLKKALFDPDQEGCPQCFHNTDRQKSLFALEDVGRSVCMKPDCFKQKQNNWLSANWKGCELRRKYKTNGFRFDNGRSGLTYSSFYGSEKPFQECKECDKLVTLIGIDGEVNFSGDGRVCLDSKCKQGLEAAARRRKQKKDSGSVDGGSREGDRAEPAAPRVAWHGEYFREEFFKDVLPGRIMALDALEPKAMIIATLAMKEGLADGIEKLCGRLLGFKVPKDYFYRLDTAQAIRALADMENMAFGTHQSQRIADVLKELAVHVVMSREFTADDRWAVAELVGIDLAKEWRITDGYLQKKTKAEILAIGKQFGVFDQEPAKTYLFETLLKKRGKFDGCKKDELVKLFLESGVDLAGVVPDEILRRQERPTYEPPDDMDDEPTCRVCGCTEDDCSDCIDATGEPCHWVEPDLCSRCADEQAANAASAAAA